MGFLFNPEMFNDPNFYEQCFCPVFYINSTLRHVIYIVVQRLIIHETIAKVDICTNSFSDIT